ncbi:protein kintoun isoform X2 [Halyomorpha halys]|uniref:protein kintoun isoform X2 n=1 Tax=Halyomorpha halys TaxID=286706 RepID=UPI0006D4D1F5|nr:protein kintoun isoform X2 [Halyomorpha halys]
MSKFEKQAFENVDITKSELDEFGEALKKEEFRKLLGEYFDEVTDPKNRAEYERDMIQLEKERGVDITFVHPTPGYVIKTSCDGERKAFINICSNDLIGRPTPTTVQQNDQIGTNWSLPHIFVPPKVDVDKKQDSCIVFDVIFHPETLELAKRNQDFKNFVNDTALSGIEDSFDTKLDRNNLRFPKMNFKGAKTASVIRKKRSDMPSCSDESPMDIPNYPYTPIKENSSPKVTKPRGNMTKEGSLYTTPKYEIKHRKGVDFHECSNAFDAKVNAVTPSELVVQIDLPLLSSTQDAKLDVCERSLSLISEKPSKYKLNISLPYAVDESSGTARFDKRTKMLIVTLPVIQKKFDELLFHRDDSGIESDVNQNPSSSDDDLSATPPIEVISASDFGEQKCDEEGIDFRTSEEVVSKFLSDDVHYVFPTYTFTNDNKCISVTMDVKNVDPSTVYHQFVLDGVGVHFKFSSLGSGFFPIHYAFCIKFPKASINPSTLKVDVWDNNLIIMLDLISCEDYVLTAYAVGTTLDNLQNISLENPIWFKDIHLTDKLVKAAVNEEISNSQVEQLCDGVSDVDLNSDLKRPDSIDDQKIELKSRRCSKTNFRPPPVALARRSILKTSRSLSESNTDDYSTWSSLDSSDNQDESLGNCSMKKTVRFSDVIYKKVFRAGSSILGQKHKNEKKARNRKKVAIKRRRSESDASEVSEVSDISDYSEVSDMSEASDGGSSDDSSSPFSRQPPPIPGSKRHRRRGTKNGRKNAASAKQNNFLLSHE